MSALERLALYGCDEPLPQRLTLRAGPLSFELVGGRFGPVHAHGHEVWHGLAFLFRDVGWGTPEPVFEVLSHDIEGEGFVLRLRGHIPCAPEDVVGQPAEGACIGLDLQVRGDADGRLHGVAQQLEAIKQIHLRGHWEDNLPLHKLSCELQPIAADASLRSLFTVLDGVQALETAMASEIAHQAV